MSQTYTDQSGATWIMRDRGWRRATPAEAEIIDEGFVTASSEALGQELKSLQGLGQVGLGGILSFMSMAQRGNRSDFQAPGTFRRQLIDTGMQNLSEASAELAEREVLQPGATFTGQAISFLPDLLGASGAIKGLSQKAATGAALREAEKATARRVGGLADNAAAEAAEPMTRQQAGTVGQIITDIKPNGFGPGSVGGGERAGMWEQLKKMPGLRGALEGIEEFAGTARPITADQRAIINSGRAEQLGFEFLPGQREGNNLIGEMIKSQPFMADSLDPILTANARNLENRVARALGVPGEGLGRGVLAQADDELGSRFANFAAKVGDDAKLPKELVDDIDAQSILSGREKRAFNLTGDEPISGQDLIELRSHVNSQLAAARQDSAEGAVARGIEQTIEAIDEIIAANVSGDDLALWRDTQQRWRVNLAVNARGVVQPDGSISLKALNNSLERGFQREYRKQLFAPTDTGLPNDVVELMDYVRVARAFESNLGDSGTATRFALGQIVRSPKEYVAQRLAAKYVRDVLLSRPVEAAALP